MKKIVEKRHKCNKCGAVRYESRMRKLKPWEVDACSQFGNNDKCWICKDKCNGKNPKMFYNNKIIVDTGQ